MPGGQWGQQRLRFSSGTPSLELKQTQSEIFPSKISAEPFHPVSQQSQHHDIMMVLVTLEQKQNCPTSNQTWLQTTFSDFQ